MKVRVLSGNFLSVAVWVGEIAQGQWRRIFLSCLVGMGEVACSLGFVWTSKKVIDIATGSSSGSLFSAALTTALLLVAQLGFSAFDMWLNGCMPVDTGNYLRRRLFRRLLKSRWNELEKYHTGDILNRLVQDTTELVRFLTMVLPAVFVTGVQLVASFLLFCKLDASLAWVLAGVLPVFLLISKLYIGKMRKYTHDIRKSDSRIQSVIQESLQHRTVIKALEKDEQRLGILDGLQILLRKQVVTKTKLSLFSRMMVGLGFNFGYLLVFLWGAVKLSTGNISFGTMTAFLQLVGRVQRPALDLTRLLPSFITTYIAAERLMELEALPSEKEEPSVLLKDKTGICFTNVCFSYEENGENILDELNLDFAPGTFVAILGETGAGKTTIARLMLALAFPTSGQIHLYNREKKILVSPATRGNFIYVPQGNTLFSGTIRDNLIMGNPDATDSEMQEVLKIAVAEFVFQLPGGLDARLNEQGGGLSEGQAQRISIARALLRPGGIFLFDEATSALDTETERLLINNLRHYRSDKTFIFITHHRHLAKECNNIVVLKGR